ncbi:atlastin-1-like [Anneissia japonica]|uniref:atlastin-1-like n=1 Tax=Anneissia japonica TaxID=1529436 RepID=UPI0014259143|nr:atlastin-1-like [Anneissia japonica]
MKRLKKCMEISPNQSKENVDLRKSIHQVFDTIMCFLMPRPGDEIVEGESSGKFKDIGNRFQVQMKELVQLLFLADVPELKRIDGKDITCESLFHYVKRYIKDITEGNMFEITCIAEVRTFGIYFITNADVTY